MNSKVLIILLFANYFFPGWQKIAGAQVHLPEIGEKAPEIEFKNIFNYSRNSVRLSEFKGKFVILDFWATWCGPCVEAFEKIDDFQTKHEDKLKFMLVTDEPLNRIREFYKKIAAKDSKLSSATGGRDIRNLFKAVQIPHYVWIDDAGIIRAITGSESLTADNIDLFLANKPFTSAVKKDAAPFSTNLKIPLLMDVELTKKVEVLNYSVLYRVSGAPSSVGYGGGTIYEGRRITVQTFSISGLYRVAYGHNKYWHVFPSNNVKLNVKDQFKYKYDESAPDSVNYGNLYSYDLIIPQQDSIQLFSAMQRDLDEKFGLKVTFSTERKKCLVLKVTDNAKIRKSTSEPYFNDTKISLQMKNQPISKLVDLLNNHYQSNRYGQVFDGTSLPFNIDLEIEVNLRNLDTLKVELEKKGFDLIEEERDVEIMVLSEPGRV